MMSRNYNIDLIKIVAMLMIVLMHSTITDVYDNESFVAIARKGIQAVGMPLFFMVSGYLMYARHKDSKYYIFKIIKIIKYVTIISVGVAVFFSLASTLRNGNIAILGFGSIITNYLGWGTIPQFWYFGCIIYIYLYGCRQRTRYALFGQACNMFSMYLLSCLFFEYLL